MPPDVDVLRAAIEVTVDETGNPRAATILNDDGHGAGARAVQWAIAAHYHPALDEAGRPIESTVRLNLVFAANP